MADGLLRERKFPTLNLDELPSNVVITYSDGGIQHISLQELLTRVKNPGSDGKEKRRRSKNHNKNIGMKASCALHNGKKSMKNITQPCQVRAA